LHCELRRKDRRVLSPLARVRKRAGKVRDMDVLIQHATTLRSSGEDDCVLRLIEVLGTRRTKRVKKLAALMREVAPRVRSELKRGRRRIEEILDADADERRAAADATADAVALTEQLAGPQRLNRATLHAYRRSVKQLRDVLQLAQGATGRRSSGHCQR
jgi:CHAD domain-containing protein